MELRLEANKAYHEIEIFDGKTKIGEAEIEVTENMLSRLLIYEPYRNMGFNLFKEKHFWAQFIFRCARCGAEWVSHPFRTDYPDDTVMREING